MIPYPQWLHVLAWFYLAACFASALVIVSDYFKGRRQKMWIMAIVWPVSALYFGPYAVRLYRKALPLMEKKPESGAVGRVQKQMKDAPPTWLQNSVAVFHCGAGCAIGDVIAESLAPKLALNFAGEFGSKLVLDFAFAYILGIVFQYFTIAPMRGLSFGKGIAAAVRADTISITLFEVGMFAWMAITYYLLFPSPHLKPDMAVFWFMMQIAMIAGFFTALAANSWLIRKGWKEKMPAVDPQQMQNKTRPQHLAA